MSLLLLFQGGQQVDLAPPPPPPTIIAIDYLSHGEAVVALGASTDIEEGASAWVSPGTKTTIQ